MVEITFEAEEVVVKFPKQLVTSTYVQDFIERLRLETILLKSQLSEEQAWELSEEVKQQWWQTHRETFSRGLNIENGDR